MTKSSERSARNRDVLFPKRVLSIFVIFLIPFALFSQESDGYGLNRPKSYKKKLHFGFTIAGNQTDFRLNPRPNSLLPDTIIGKAHYHVKTVYSQPGPGFAIGLVTDARLHEYVRLRFTPGISFGTRRINYTLANTNEDSTKVFQKTVESVFLIFPLEVKIQSKRLGNFSAYVIGVAVMRLTSRPGKGRQGFLPEDPISWTTTCS